MTDRPGSGRSAARLRTARPGDVAACLDTWHAALDHYGGRVGRPPMPRSYGQLELLVGHTLETDPERFWVAVRQARTGREEVVGFVSAILRGTVWFLAMLFVLPGDQESGLGTALLDRVLPAPGDALVRAACTDAAQPVSNAMYARLGIVPRIPVLQLVGRPDRAPLPTLPSGVRAVPFDDLGWSAGGVAAERVTTAIDALDRAVLGYGHPADHAFLWRTRRRGYLYEAAGGHVLGYGYVSESGRLGPVALADPSLAGPVLGHLVGAIEPAGAYVAWVPGSFDQAAVALLRSGFRLEDFPALLCWDRDFGRFDRYLPISLAIL